MIISRTILVYSLVLLFQLNICAQYEHLNSNAIGDSLLRHADAVVRFHKVEVNIESIKKKEIKEAKAITVFNSDASNQLIYQFRYNKQWDKLKSLQLIYLDKDGNVIREVKTKELIDRSATSRSALVSDSRVKYFEFKPTEYPVTIYWEEESISENTWTSFWIPITEFNISIQSAEYQINVYEGIKLNEKLINFEGLRLSNKSQNSYELKNIKAIGEEVYGPEYIDVFPIAIFVPDEFNFMDHQGTFGDYNVFGEYIHSSFLAELDSLNIQNIKLELGSLINDDLSTKEKVQEIYSYVQNNTRYVLILEDDGGLRPLSPAKVHEVKYGDCKALSYYTKALLDVFDIPSNYVVVRSGSAYTSDIFKDFAISYPGNHIIINVPMEQDTLWLDCTNSDGNFNYLSSFTDDRLVAEIKPTGANLIRTPKYPVAFRTQKDSSSFELQLGLVLQGVFKRSYSKDKYSYLCRYDQYSYDDKEDYFRSNILGYVPSPEIISHKTIKRAEDNEVDVILEVSTDKVVSQFESYLELPLKSFRFDLPNLKGKTRNKPIVFVRDKAFEGYHKIKIPEVYTLFDIPRSDFIMDNDFFNFVQRITLGDDNELIIEKSLIIKEGTFPPERLLEIKKSIKEIKKIESQTITFEKK